MILSIKFYFILALIFVSVHTQKQAPLIECTVDDLAPVAGIEPKPVCAWFNPTETKCKNALCNKNIDMVNNACYLPGIIGYTLGKCPESDPVVEDAVNTISRIDTCADRDTLSKVCIDIYAPVCAYYACSADASFSGKCSQTFPNRCQACADPNVKYVIPEECPVEIKYPIDPLPVDPLPISIKNPIKYCPSTACPKIWKPVCGWFDTTYVKCIKYPCAQTYANSCFACKDSNVVGFTPGPCPTGPVISVDPAISAIDLTKKAADGSSTPADGSSTPADGSSTPEDGSSTPEDGSSTPADGATTLAKAIDISPNIKISPPYPVDYICKDEYKTDDCSTYKYDPVCAIINDIKYCKSLGLNAPCKYTFPNKCVACHDDRVLGFNYYDISYGKCPKAPSSPYPSNMIRCLKKVCPLIYAPVCAIQLPCSKTYSNSCFACLNGNTLGYINGPCPNTLPILDDFDKYTCSAADRFSDVACQPTQSYNYVCAYLNYRCTYGQCTTYFTNKCEACHSVMVEKVTPGLCPNDAKWFKGVKSYVCKDKDRNANLACPEFEIGVCGIRTQGFGSYPNVCTACKDQNVIEVFNKACPAIN